MRACDYYIDALREIRKKQAEALPARLRVRVALCLTAALLVSQIRELFDLVRSVFGV